MASNFEITKLPNGLFAPIYGVVDGVAAKPGTVGEVFSTTGSETISDSTLTSIASISLTAGEWDISGVVVVTDEATHGELVISSTAGDDSGTVVGFDRIVFPVVLIGEGYAGFCTVPSFRISITEPTDYYLNVIVFGSSGVTPDGTIRAVRAR